MVGWLTDTVGARPGIAFALVAATLACLATLGLRAHTPQPERVFGSVCRWFVEGVEVGEVLWSARRGLVSP